MNNNKPAFDRRSNEYKTLDPVDVIRLMNGNIDADGCLMLQALDDFGEPTDDCYTVKLRGFSDVETVTESYIRLENDLREAFAVMEDAGADPYDESEAALRLPPRLQNVWNTFVRPLDIGDVDRDFWLYAEEQKMDCIPLAPEEEAVIKAVEEAKEADARARLFDSKYSINVINRAQRVYQLMTLNAPEEIVKNECKELARVVYLYFNDVCGDGKAHIGW